MTNSATPRAAVRGPVGRRLAALFALLGVIVGVAVVVAGGLRDDGPPQAHAASSAERADRAAAARAADRAAARTIRAEAGRRATLRALRVRALAAAARSADGHVFPIRGRHDRGRYETNDFGGGRGHQGQDMFAACGTPLVAALGGRVLRAASEGAGGNYVVIAGSDRRAYVYMHLQQPSPLKTGDKVATGQPIGRVGDSGNADGCHLHFELWSAPGWYTGGRPLDTARMLAAWDAAS